MDGWMSYRLLFIMGNDYICGKEIQRQQEFEISVEHRDEPSKEPQQRINNVQFLDSLPNLTEEVSEMIISEKPYESEFKDNYSLRIFKLNKAETYHGFIDQTNAPHGFGKIYFEEGMLMVGEFKHGLKVGQHYLFLPDGSFYKGIIQNDTITEGIYYSKDFQYTGQLQDYQLHGKGNERHKDYEFDGKYQRGERVEGVLKWKENNFVNIYKGKFNKDGQFDGDGQLVTREGVYRGTFKNGKKQGIAVFEFNNGLTFAGTYANGQRNGKGRIINSNKSICYEGSFLNGLPHGWGSYCDEQGNIKEGEFICGVAAVYYEKIEAAMV